MLPGDSVGNYPEGQGTLIIVSGGDNAGDGGNPEGQDTFILYIDDKFKVIMCFQVATMQKTVTVYVSLS